MGSGDAPREVYGDGVFPRERALRRSEASPDDRADDDGCIISLVFSPSSLSTDINRRVRGRTDEAVVVVVVVVVVVPGALLSRAPLLELIP